MHEPHIVVCVFPDGVSRIATTTDIETALRKWRQRYGDFLPAVAFEGDPVAFTRLFQLSLPHSTSTIQAADLLHRAPVSQVAQPAVFRQIRKLRDKAWPLFAEWRAAVDSALQ